MQDLVGKFFEEKEKQESGSTSVAEQQFSSNSAPKASNLMKILFSIIY